MGKVRQALLDRGRLRTFVTVLVGVVLCFVTFDKIVMPWYVDHGVTHVVPSVVGLDVQQASSTLEAQGLEAVPSEIKPDPKAPVGVVIAQNPIAESLVKEGRRIYLTVSGGEVLVHVPRLRGLSVRDARFALERAGLHLGSISPVSSETYFQNTIVDQTTSPGEKVAKGSTIGIIVSTGKASKALSAPDLTGKTVSEAQRIVERDGLRIGRITYQKGLNLIPNTIVDQFPRAGEAVVAGAVIDLFVARLAAGEDELPGRED